MKKLLPYLCLIVTLWSCQKPFKDYKKVNDDIYYKLIEYKEEGLKKADENYYLLLAYVLRDSANKIISWQNIERYIPIETENKLYPLFKSLHVGDSIHCKIKGNCLYEFNQNKNIHPNSFYNFECRIKKILSPKAYNSYLNNEAEMLEMKLFNKYLRTNQLTIDTILGFYFNLQPSNSGDTIKKGKIVQLHYKAYFLDNYLFDSTLINEPLEITYGVPNQVIKGLEIVLNKMKEKDQAVLIFPSVFGFGEQGSSTGIVPPYTSLKYKIHIINVKDPEEL